MKNIVLIGMPGAGKSTTGVLLAKTLGMSFMDTDLMIQQNTGKLLQEIIDRNGILEFLEIEERTILGLDVENYVIATGGSAVYSSNAVKSLKRNGIFIYFMLPYEEMVKRINNINTRGIAMEKGQKLIDLYNERIPLYEKYADIIIDCAGKNVEDVIFITVNKLGTEMK